MILSELLKLNFVYFLLVLLCVQVNSLSNVIAVCLCIFFSAIASLQLRSKLWFILVLI